LIELSEAVWTRVLAHNLTSVFLVVGPWHGGCSNVGGKNHQHSFAHQRGERKTIGPYTAAKGACASH
jgi:hypothetical protein